MAARTLKDTTGADISVESLRDKTKISDLTGKDIVLGGVDATGAIVAIDPTAIAPSAPKWKKVTAFQNGWTNQDVATFGELSYCKDSQGFVRIEGVIKGGAANSVVFTIDDPTCRPKKAISRTTHGQNGAGYGIVIGTDGNVTVFTIAGYTTTTFVALTCVFPADQVFF